MYILIESVIYSLINDDEYDVDFCINEFVPNINTQGFIHTALGEMAQGIVDKEIFIKHHNFSINSLHFRKVIKADGDEMDTSTLLSDIKTFFLRYSMPEEFKSDLAKIITELADNAKEHGKADCLVDIDVTEPEYICTTE